MSVPRGTTPTFVCEFEEEGLDLTNVDSVYVSFSYTRKLANGKTETHVFTKTGSSLEIEPKKIKVYLTQQDTFKFDVGTIEIQANWLTWSGQRYASEIVKYEISKQLLGRIL